METSSEHPRPAEDESTSVMPSRLLRRFFLAFAILSFVVTMLFVFFKLPAATVPAVVFVVSFGIFALTALLEHSVRFKTVTPPIEVQVGEPIDTGPTHIATTSDPYPVEAFPAPGPEERIVQAKIDRAESGFGLKIVGVILVIALVLAAAILSSRLLGVGALIIFLILALFGGPYWLAATQEKADDERERAGIGPGASR